MLRTDCIYTPRSVEDGVRVSVMSRHTQNDGETPDLEIVEGISYLKWWRELAPQGRTVGRYHRGEIGFEVLRAEYLERLCTDPDSVSRVYQLIELASSEDVTVLCKEPRELAHLCHRSILAEYCLDRNPGLDVEIN